MDRCLRDERKFGNLRLDGFFLSFTYCVLNPVWQILIFALGIINLTKTAYSIHDLKNSAHQVQSIYLESSFSVQSIRLLYKDQEHIRLSNTSGIFDFQSPICVDRSSILLNSSLDTWSASDIRGITSFLPTSPDYHWLRTIARHLKIDGAELHLSILPPWQWVVDNIAGDMFLGITLVLTSLFGVMHRTRLAKFVLELQMSLLCTLRFLSALAYFLDGQVEESISSVSCCILILITTAAIERAKTRFVPACMMLAVLWFAARLAIECLLFRRCCAHLLASPPMTTLGVGALSTIFMLLHWHRRRRAARAAEADRARFEAAWERLRLEEGDAVVLLSAAAAASDADVVRPARQTCRIFRRSVPSSVLSLRTMSGQLLGADALPGDAARDVAPVTSLDQLYAQVPRLCHSALPLLWRAGVGL